MQTAVVPVFLRVHSLFWAGMLCFALSSSKKDQYGIDHLINPNCGARSFTTIRGEIVYENVTAFCTYPEGRSCGR